MKNNHLLGIFSFLARTGEKVLDLIFGMFMILVLLYGGYCVYDIHQVRQNAFVSEKMLKYKPDIEDEEAPTLKEMQSIASDVFAWLTVDGTHIDYPVVKCNDNFDYVNRDVYGDFSFSGAVFLDCQNHIEMTDSYNILYGHHMDNGAMFGDLEKFESKDFFDKHKTGVLQTIGAVYYIQFFAFCSIDAYDKMLARDPLEVTGENMSEFIDYIYAHSLCSDEIDISSDDKIVSLYTCHDAVTNGRYLLFGKLIRK
ncbi:MAG: class B sortase [Ruminococcus sp.]|nr:class B sortase [Ruminococcus sp.]